MGTRVVSLLLKSPHVDPGRRELWGRTPLALAARGGHTSVVRSLLERGRVQADVPDAVEWTLLLCAAHNGYESVVRAEIDLNKPGPGSNTPLLTAAKAGHVSAVRLLLEQPHILHDVLDMTDRTAFMWAANNSREAVVKILLREKDVNSRSRDNWGQTVLELAVSGGCFSVVAGYKPLASHKGVSLGRYCMG
ncbi:ankyrin [Choiromyces venosus 120613-1]|uniref:Ankyrin n=1 Tax=Choiromyces venosus 120613-1 TaxID=1336337 RepID=A0A3N4J1N6_9PEZI|nr:ankyrin [Choiromyces venosus 120613-1]